jgi:peptidoglycan/LPS O-acetylase OafA/YrhL
MKLIYRPEIDGLRAVAVGAVILYHANIPQFEWAGGFMGVDIFFVISGYLITSIILKELIATNTFSFKLFYERRVRRIIPVLCLVMISSLPFAWFYLFPSYLLEFSKSILLSSSFLSNYYFYYSGQEYGAIDGFLKPFLHTWSLSVEEQFYILFPIILLIIFKFYRYSIIFFLIAGFLASFFLANFFSSINNSLSFYFIITRIWELLAGSVLAYFEITQGKRGSYKKIKKILPTLGLVLIIHSFIYFDDQMYHPSYYTLSPIVGTCLIIWFSDKKDIITMFLSTKLIVGIGLISYSLYLWHYPIFSFVKINGFVSGDLIKKLLIIPILFILSIFSYLFVEKKFRNKKFEFRKLSVYLIFTFLILIIFNVAIIKNDGFPNRFAYFNEINPNYNPDNNSLRKNRYEEVILDKKKFNPNKYKILIIGDSHGEDLYLSLYRNNELFKDVDFIFTQIDKINLTKLENFDLINNADRIILSARWIDKNRFNFLDENIEQIKKLNNDIYITSHGNEYKMPTPLYTILDYEIISKKKKIDYFDLKNKYFKNRLIKGNSNINNIIKNFSKKNNLQYLNKEDYMCDISKNECYYADEEGNKLMYDSNHYTASGAKFFGKKIKELDWLILN